MSSVDPMAVFRDSFILPSQVEPGEETLPVQKLCLALLEHAIKDFRLMSSVPRDIRKGRQNPTEVKRVARKRSEFHDKAAQWFAGAEAKITFEQVCTALRLEPDYIRKLLSHAPVKMARQYRRNGYLRAKRIAA